MKTGLNLQVTTGTMLTKGFREKRQLSTMQMRTAIKIYYRAKQYFLN